MPRTSLRLLAACTIAAAIGPAAPSSADAYSCCAVKQIAAGGQDTAAMLDAGRVRISSSSGVAVSR